MSRRAFVDSLERMRRSKAVAAKYGVKLIAYEGGQHMVAFVKDRELVEKISATMHACNRDPRMGHLYTRYFDEWAAVGGDVFTVFSSIGRYSNHGAWGPTRNTPKTRPPSGDLCSNTSRRSGISTT